MIRALLILIILISFKGFTQSLVSYDHNGVQRSYNYYVPSTWNITQQVPLLFVLHGLTQTGSGVMDITGFNDIAEENNFIVCYPNGLNESWNANMNITFSSADDKGFLEALTEYFQVNFNTDPSRQYLCGFSTGGFMSHKMVCESSECYAAIATVSGNMSDTVYSNCLPQGSPSVLHIHGTADAVVPYNGGPSTGVSVDEVMTFWQNHLACSTNPVISPMPNTNLFDLSSPERWVWQNCGQDELELIRVDGGGHQWPGITTFVGGVGTINMDFYSPDEIWDFLSDKTCQELSTNKLLKKQIRISPNPASEILAISAESDIENVQILDFNGRKLLKLNGIGREQIISLEKLDQGIYILVLTCSDGIFSTRIIKTNN